METRLAPEWLDPVRAAETLRALIGDPLILLRPVPHHEGADVVDFSVAWANDQACTFLRMGLDQLVGKQIAEAPCIAADWLPRYVAVLDTGRPARFVIPPDSRRADAGRDQVLAVQVVGLDGGLAVTWRDVTATARAEDQSRFNALILDQVDAAVVTTDSDLRITFWNKGAESLYGWTVEEAIGQVAPTFVAPRMTAEEVADQRSAAQAGPVDLEMELQRKDGTTRTVALRISPLEGTSGLAGFVTVAVDVSARAEADAERARTAEFIQVLTDGMTEGMLACDAEGRTTFVNPSAEALLGWTRAELLGKDLHAITHSRRPDGSGYAKADCPIMLVRVSRCPVRVDRDFFLRGDSTWAPVAYTAAPLGANQGDAGSVVVFRDASAEHREEQKAQEALEALYWVGRMHDALEEGRFVMFAQPIVDVTSGATHHHELLLRMRTPGGELIAPDQFIPIAEEYGFIGRIDQWVAREAVTLSAEGHSIAFNLSALSVSDRQVLQCLRDLLARRVAGRGQLICEITESALLVQPEVAGSFVRELVDLGCQIALDDFGAGFAGFGYLQQFPVSTLKIDQQFVTDALREQSSRHVVSAVVALARAFDMTTVAEGVEDTHTLNLMRDLGVDFVQGYVFGRPQPATELLSRRARP